VGCAPDIRQGLAAPARSPGPTTRLGYHVGWSGRGSGPVPRKGKLQLARSMHPDTSLIPPEIRRFPSR